jgi:hypothetical protein
MFGLGLFVVWSSAAPEARAQIGKVDGRHVQPSASVWSIFSFQGLCGRPLCPPCKRRYCDINTLPGYGYSNPRWYAFPGTTPTYTPKKKDIGISAPAPEPAPTETPTGDSRTTPNPDVGTQVRDLTVPRDDPSFPISATPSPANSPDREEKK